MKIYVIGRGRLGNVLHTALAEAGIACEIYSAREPAPIILEPGDGVILTVPDTIIPVVAKHVASNLTGTNYYLVHCSGVSGLDILGSGEFHPIAMHPFQTIASESPTNVIKNIPWGVTCSDEAIQWVEKLLNTLNGFIVRIPDSSESRAIYHATAVLACNIVQTYLRSAQALAKTINYNTADLLKPIVRTTIERALNEIAAGKDVQITGPAARADTTTIAKHLQYLPPAIKEVYKLGQAATILAICNSLTTEDCDNTLTLLHRVTHHRISLIITREGGKSIEVLALHHPVEAESSYTVPTCPLQLGETTERAAKRYLTEVDSTDLPHTDPALICTLTTMNSAHSKGTMIETTAHHIYHVRMTDPETQAVSPPNPQATWIPMAGARNALTPNSYQIVETALSQAGYHTPTE